jgi:hypothetical protein
MESLPPVVLAKLTVEQFLREHPASLDAALLVDLQVRIETAIRTAAGHERQAAVRLCRDRAALWTKTAGNPSAAGALRTDARARENEATYIADAIAALGTT